MLSQYDQSIRDAGYKYIPQSQYLLDPFQIPQGSENEVPTGIATTYQAQNMGGGGEGFNPYNTDMSQIRQDYSPYAYRQAMASSGVGIPSGILSDSKFLYAPQSQFQKALGTAINFIPGIGTIKRGIDVIGGALKGILPENQRAIMENEARGAGIFTDDIGRIVTDDYNTAGGIMAGYNLNKIDADTFTKRRDTINKTLGGKYNLSADQIKAAIANPNYTGPGADLINRLGLLDEAEEDILGLQKRTKDIITFREKKKAEEAAAKKAEEDARLQAEIDAYNRRQAEVARRSRDSDNDGVPDYVEDAGGSYDGGYQGAEGGFENTSSSTGGKSSSSSGGGPYGGGPGGIHSGYMYGGRVPYMMGGLTDLVDIYD